MCVGNARARGFLTRYTCCNMCIVTETHVHMRSRPPPWVAQPASGVVGGLVFLVAYRLELEGAV